MIDSFLFFCLDMMSFFTYLKDWETMPIKTAILLLSTLLLVVAQEKINFKEFREYQWPKNEEKGMFINDFSHVKWPCKRFGHEYNGIYKCTFKQTKDSVLVFLDDVHEKSGYAEGATPLFIADGDELAPSYLSFPITEDALDAIMFSNSNFLHRHPLSASLYRYTKKRLERVEKYSNSVFTTYESPEPTRIPIHLAEEIFNLSLDTLSIDTLIHGEYRQIFAIPQGEAILYLEKIPDYKCLFVYDIAQVNPEKVPSLHSFDTWDKRVEEVLQRWNSNEDELYKQLRNLENESEDSE